MSPTPLKILSVTSGRADVSILAPVWHALAADPGFDLHVFATGAHASGARLVGEAVPPGTSIHFGGADPAGGSARDVAEAMADIQRDAARVIADAAPDLVLVIGDRVDMVPAALAAVPFNLPIAHLHGGEVTEGALDDRLRHAITKLAHIHLASCKPAARRLEAMGEEPWRIAVTGAPGLDTLRAANLLSRGDFARATGFEDITGLRLVTVHPETNAPDPAAPLTAVLAALDAHPGPTLITGVNADPGGAAMREEIGEFVAARPHVRFVETLGRALYPSALHHASVMIGNSSSGIVEAEFFGLPVIDVGDRQAGRDRGVNVRSVPNDLVAVSAALAALPPRGPGGGGVYGDGHAASRILAALSERMANPELLRKRLRGASA